MRNTVDRFDPDRHLKLKTLAEHRIRGALLDYLRRIDPLPRSVRGFQKQRDAVIDEFSVLRKTPSDPQIAEALGVSTTRYITLSRMITAAAPISIHESAIARLCGAINSTKALRARKMHAPISQEPKAVDLYVRVVIITRLDRTRLFFDLIGTLRGGPKGTARERSHAADQLFSTVRTAPDRP